MMSQMNAHDLIQAVAEGLKMRKGVWSETEKYARNNFETTLFPKDFDSLKEKAFFVRVQQDNEELIFTGHGWNGEQFRFEYTEDGSRFRMSEDFAYALVEQMIKEARENE